MRLVMSVVAVLAVVWFGVSNVGLGGPDGISEVALLVSAGVTLWVAGVLARPGASHPAERPATSAALAAPLSAGGRTGDDEQQAADRQSGKATAIAAV